MIPGYNLLESIFPVGVVGTGLFCVFQSGIRKGGGVDISSFSGKKACGQKETLVKYGQSLG